MLMYNLDISETLRIHKPLQLKQFYIWCVYFQQIFPHLKLYLICFLGIRAQMTEVFVLLFAATPFIQRPLPAALKHNFCKSTVALHQKCLHTEVLLFGQFLVCLILLFNSHFDVFI